VAQLEADAELDTGSPAIRTLVTVLSTIVFVALLSGMVLGASLIVRNTKVSTSVVDVAEATQIVIDTGEADVKVVQGDPGVVTVNARVTSGLRQTNYQIGQRGDEIKIVSSCQAWLSPGCGVEATMEIPEGFPVVIRTSSGNVDADSIREGVLTVLTGSGNISATNLRVDEFSATSKSGDVNASFRSQPFAFKATTTSGDIAAQMRKGKRTYTVTAKTGSGDVDSSVTSDPKGQGFIRVNTQTGNIKLTQR
jgi:hypothetical protein